MQVFHLDSYEAEAADERLQEAVEIASESMRIDHGEDQAVTLARACLYARAAELAETRGVRLDDIRPVVGGVAAALGYGRQDASWGHPAMRCDSDFAPEALLARGQGGTMGIMQRERSRDIQGTLQPFSVDPAGREYVNPYVEVAGKAVAVAGKTTQLPIVESSYRQLRHPMAWYAIKIVGDHWTDRPYAARRAYNKQAVQLRGATNALLDKYEQVLRDGDPHTGVRGLKTLDMPEVTCDLTSADISVRVTNLLEALDLAAADVSAPDDNIEYNSLMLPPSVIRRFTSQITTDNIIGMQLLMTGLEARGITGITRIRNPPAPPAGFGAGHVVGIAWEASSVESSSGTLARPVAVTPTLVSSAQLHAREDIYAIKIGGVDLPRPDTAVRIVFKVA